eukprot:UN3729
MLEPLGYRLSHLVSRDAIFVRGTGYADEAWRRGYRCHPHWRTKHEEPEYVSAYSYDFRRWADISLPLEESCEASAFTAATLPGEARPCPAAAWLFGFDRLWALGPQSWRGVRRDTGEDSGACPPFVFMLMGQ